MNYPRPGQRFLLNGERVRVVGEFPADPELVPVQNLQGRLLLVRVAELEPEPGIDFALPRK